MYKSFLSLSLCVSGRDWVTESLYTAPDLQEGTTKDPASSRATEGQRSLTVTDRATLSLDLEALAGRTVEGRTGIFRIFLMTNHSAILEQVT